MNSKPIITSLLTMSLFGATLFASCHQQRETVAQNRTSISDKCDTPRRDALRDLRSNNLKYYTFGIVAAPKRLVDSLAKLNVEVVSLGCTVDEKLSCYNSVTDSIVFAKYRVRIADIR